ncbi:MAG: hypothetical protein V3W44_10920 [Dehalococcoidales bacterium]
MSKLNEKSDTFQKKLPVRLTDEELRHRGDELATKLDDLDAIEARVTAAKEAAKPPRQQTEQRIQVLRGQIRSKSEDRLVDCEEIKRFKERCAETVRQDTGEIVATRPLTAREMQTELSVLKGGQSKVAPSKPGKPS